MCFPFSRKIFSFLTTPSMTYFNKISFPFSMISLEMNFLFFLCIVTMKYYISILSRLQISLLSYPSSHPLFFFATSSVTFVHFHTCMDNFYVLFIHLHMLLPLVLNVSITVENSFFCAIISIPMYSQVSMDNSLQTMLQWTFLP